MNVLEMRRVQPSTFPVSVLMLIVILFHTDLLLILRDMCHICHMARPLVRLRNSPDFWFFVDLDIDLLRGVVPVVRVAPSDALVPIVEVQVFVCFVQTPGNVAGARASDEIPVVYPIVSLASADVWVFALAGEKSMGTPVNEVGGWIVFRAEGGSDGGACGQKDEDGCDLHDKFSWIMTMCEIRMFDASGLPRHEGAWNQRALYL